MKLSPAVSTALLVFAAFSSHQVSGHGYLVQPLAKFIGPNIDKTQYSSTIDSNKLFPDGTFNTDPTVNVKSFVENYKKSKYKSLKAMIEDNQVLVSNDATASCGFSSPEKTSYGALNDTIYWGRSDDLTLDEGFVHVGPCETWCGDKRVQQNMNCDKTYNSASGKGAAAIPIDNSVCTNAKRLTFYWIAMHGATWQVYVNCVNINGGTGGAGSSSPKKTATTTTAPATSNTRPRPTTATPTPAVRPTTATRAPAAAPTTEDSSIAGEASTTSDKCAVRRRIRG